MNFYKINKSDTANGIGVRVSLFCAGCRHKCKGCFNYELWDYKKGKPFTQETINEIIKYLDHDYIDGLSLLGGEPLDEENIPGMLKLILSVKEKLPQKTIWCYSGWTIEELIKRSKNNVEIKDILNNIDVLIDGKFEKDLFDLSLRFRGSSNQRVIDMKKTMKENDSLKVVLLEGVS